MTSTHGQRTVGHAVPPSPPSVHGLRPLLRVPQLRRLILVRMLASFGDGAFQGALANAVLFDPSRQSTAATIAAGFAVLLLPYSLIGPFAGALLDRWSRRQVLVLANLVRSAIIAVLAVLLAFGLPLWMLFAVSLVVMGCGRFVGSGLSASLPHVIAPDSLVGANALATTAGSVATVVGGGYAIGLRTVLGTGNVPIAVVTGSVILFYVGSALLAGRFTRWSLGPDETDEPPQPLRAVLEGFAAGMRQLVRRPSAGLSVLMVVLVRFCFGLSTLVVLLLFQHHFTEHHGIFRSGIAGIAEVLGVSAVGLFLGAVATAPMVALLGRTRYVVLLLLLSAVVVAAAGSQFTQLSTLITAVVLAFSYQSSKVCADSVVQRDSGDAYIGRVFALYDTANNVFYVAAFALGVGLVPWDGRGLAPVIMVAALYLLTAVGYGAGMRAVHRRRPELAG
ncbi:MFS transporter [Nakamurella endophytica]|uniref:MFS transporter n=1 Tax=Nakamurella endophytica TaxID=1748367 RepID=A0A917WDE9_9ACTN|nr:MFS transporter [Nakamurella endophytica]GGL96828.1 MFS transporter [Nakamurella endophytica]